LVSIKGLSIYLTPFIPLSIIGRCILSMRGKDIKREAKPLFDSLFYRVVTKGFWGATSLKKTSSYGEYKRGISPSINKSSSFPE